MEYSSVLTCSIKPIIWVSRCIGQLPVIWNERQSRWHVAPWYHPQYFYFIGLLLFRALVYGCMSYTIIASMFYEEKSISMSMSYLAESCSFWLRQFFAPYALLLNLRPLSEALDKLQEMDSILRLQNSKSYHRKPYMFTLLIMSVTVVFAGLLAWYERSFQPWYDLPNLPIGWMLVSSSCLDVIMGTTILTQFCLGLILLQQRTALLSSHLKEFHLPVPFLGNLAKGTEPTSSSSKSLRSVQSLRYSYLLLCQVAKAIHESFEWPIFFFSLGNIMILTVNVYALSVSSSFESVLMKDMGVKKVWIVLTCHAIFSLTVLFYYADKVNDEVSSLQMDLQALISCPSPARCPELNLELWQFYQSVCMSPPEKPTAARFYDVGRNLLPAVLGVVVTYAIVLMQYETSRPR